MTIATLPGTTDVDLCDHCEKVLPARDRRNYTPRRAAIILAKGYCICPAAPEEVGVLASMDPATRNLYQELMELSRDEPEALSEPETPAETTRVDTAVFDVPTVSWATSVPHESPPQVLVIDGGGLIMGPPAPAPRRWVSPIRVVRDQVSWPVKRRE